MGPVSVRRVVGAVGVGLCLLGSACGRTLTEADVCDRRAGTLLVVGDRAVVVDTIPVYVRERCR